jgi:molybdate transport system ATP-binding protein
MGTFTATLKEPPVSTQRAALEQSPIPDLQSLIALQNVNVALNGHRVLHGISWELQRGENWAFFGHNGAGKSTLLRLLRGEIWPAPVDGGTRIYNFNGKPTESPIGIQQRMAIVSAEQQQRYLRVHGRKYGDDFSPRITAREIVFTGILGSELVTRKAKPAELKKVAQVMRDAGIDDLADAPFDKLSQGQLRKVLIARALAGEPDVLILDEVGVGLDAHSRHALLEMIQRVASPAPTSNLSPPGEGSKRGVQILMTTHRRDELIPAITYVMELKGGHITSVRRLAHDDGQRAGVMRHASWTAVNPQSKIRNEKSEIPFLINIQNANVALDEGAKVVLHDVNWRMNAGEHWMILGDNGVGKSTLLKLIMGDLWPAHGGSIERFNQHDFRNVWEIKRRIGYVSAELQARYHADLTAEQVIATGFNASVGWLQRITKAQQQRVQDMIDLFDLRPLAKRSILEMSYGQARKVLTARAMVNAPALLILDEVFDGLDAQFRGELAEIIEATAKQAGVILVTHHEADVLPCITHRMMIEKGRIVRQEQRA